MKYEYFIASRWRNKDQVVDLVKKLRQKGKIVYSFFEGDGTVATIKDLDDQHEPEVFMQQFESTPNWKEDAGIKAVFDMDMNALKNAKHCILLLPAGKSAHIEAGTAYGLGKKLSVIGEQKEAESLYLIFDHFYPSIDTFLGSIK